MNCFYRASFSIVEILAIGAIITKAIVPESVMSFYFLGFAVAGGILRAAIAFSENDKLMKMQFELHELNHDATEKMVTIVSPVSSDDDSGFYH